MNTEAKQCNGSNSVSFVDHGVLDGDHILLPFLSSLEQMYSVVTAKDTRLGNPGVSGTLTS